MSFESVRRMAAEPDGVRSSLGISGWYVMEMEAVGGGAATPAEVTNTVQAIIHSKSKRQAARMGGSSHVRTLSGILSVIANAPPPVR